MESPNLEKESIIKDGRIPFRLEKVKIEPTDTANKDIKYLFRLEKENKAIKDRIFGDKGNVFRLEK